MATGVVAMEEDMGAEDITTEEEEEEEEEGVSTIGGTEEDVSSYEHTLQIEEKTDLLTFIIGLVNFSMLLDHVTI